MAEVRATYGGVDVCVCVFVLAVDTLCELDYTQGKASCDETT